MARRNARGVHAVEPDLVERDPLVDDDRQLVDEPRIDPTRVVDGVDRHSTAEQLADLEDPLRGGDRDLRHQFVVIEPAQLALGRIAVETHPALLE